MIDSDAGNIAAQQSRADVVVQTLGQLDILAVNSGIVDMRPLEDLDEAAFDRSFAINVISPGPVATPLYNKLGMAKAEDESAFTVGGKLVIDGDEHSLTPIRRHAVPRMG